MPTVNLCKPTRNLAGELASMREWLDRHLIQPADFRYNCDRGGSMVVVQVTLKTEREAAEFVNGVGGVVVASSSGR